jgi:hypothetical protein
MFAIRSARTIGFVAFAAGSAYWLTRRRRPPPPMRVRDAGPAAMTCPPREWDAVDQKADESFPASDPPGTY